MTLKITQHHTADHNWLRDGILAESTRLATPVDIGGPYHLGDPAHIQEHNRTTVALQTLADAAGCAVVLPPERALGDVGHKEDHLAWEQALAQIQITEGWNDATGGTVSEYSDSRGFRWRRHTFTQDGTFTVKRALRPFTIALVGAGGSGGGGFIGAAGYSGGGGGGGGGWEITQPLTTTDYQITVGAGGPASGYNGGGTTGGSTIAAGITVGGGGGGQSGQGIQDRGLQPTPGGQGSAGGTSDGGTGSVVTFPGKAIRDAHGMGNAGTGGGGGGQDGPGGGGPGQPGAVTVEYQVAPYNEATGGTVNDFTKDGKRYRAHIFTQSGTLSVRIGSKPFRVLCVGGGGKGGGPGGGGGAVNDQTIPGIPAGDIAVTVGGSGQASTLGTLATGLPGLSPEGNTAGGKGGQPGGGAGGDQRDGGGPGADGTQSDATGTLTYYGGGGAGVWFNGPTYSVPGGKGGGGGCSSGFGADGLPNTGGGGGGGQHQVGQGGSGLVVVVYEVKE